MSKENRIYQLALAVTIVATTTVGCDRGITKAVEITPQATAFDTVPSPSASVVFTRVPEATVTIPVLPTSTGTPESTPTNIPTQTSTRTPTPEKPTLTPTKEEQKIMVASGKLNLYEGQGGNISGYLIAGKEFEVLQSNNGWLEIQVTEVNGAKWTRWIQEGGSYYKKGEPPPTPKATEVIRNFPREIVLADGRLIIINESMVRGLIIRPYEKKEDGSYIEGEEAVKINTEYINQMFGKYNTGGVILEIHFSTFKGNANISDNSSLIQTRWDGNGNKVLYYISINESYNPNVGWQLERVLFEVNATGLIGFLQGNYHGEGANLPLPIDLRGLDMPARLRVK